MMTNARTDGKNQRPREEDTVSGGSWVPNARSMARGLGGGSVAKEYLRRVLDVSKLVAERSLFLLGPRQTGKSSYIREQLRPAPALSYSLLDQGLLLRTLARPTLIREEVEAKNVRDSLVYIDEIQKCPALLDEAQLMIEERAIRFLFTGSSARRLRAAGTNMLGGRARTRTLHPFVYPEIRGGGFSLERIFERGLLPPHYLSSSPEEDLAAYLDTYLADEIAAEGAARNLPAFARFLETAATANTRIVNYTNIASDAQIPRQTVKSWFDILTETLIGFFLEPFTRSVKRKAITTAKFYLFDPGVVRALRRFPVVRPESADFGGFFEHLVFHELRSWIDYRSPRSRLCYWRSTSGFEVDFVVDEEVAIEVKAAERAQERHLRGLRALREEGIFHRYILVCRENRPRMVDGVEILPVEEFLEALWGDTLVAA